MCCSAYGTGACLYIYPAGCRPGHFNDYTDMFLLGYVYRDLDGGYVLQYRQLDALEDDPRREVAA